MISLIESKEGGTERSDHLCEDRKSYKMQLEEVTIREEIMQRQKLKSKWITREDANSKYFHVMLSLRKKKKMQSEAWN